MHGDRPSGETYKPPHETNYEWGEYAAMVLMRNSTADRLENLRIARIPRKEKAEPMLLTAPHLEAESASLTLLALARAEIVDRARAPMAVVARALPRDAANLAVSRPSSRAS